VNSNKNYADARQFCITNNMQLYDIKDETSSLSKSELLAYANKKYAASTGISLFIKGRKGSDCSSIDKTTGNFTDGFGLCNRTIPSICEFINNAREFHL
jgi:hypothetical protein